MVQTPAFKANYFLYTTAALVAVLPFKKLVVPLLIINIIAWLLNDSMREKIKNLKHRRIVWLFLLPFGIYLIGMVYSDNQPFGWKDIELKLSLFIFPLIYASTSYTFHQYKKLIALVFILSMTITSLISIVYGILVFKQLPTYEMIDLFLHSTYLSMYCNLALAISYVLVHRNKLNTLENRLLVVAFIILSFTVLISLSKTGIFSWLLLITGMIFHHYILVKKQYLASLLLMVFGLLLIFTAYFTLPPVKDRFEYVFKALSKQANQKVDQNTTESTQVRFLIWEQAIELIKEEPLVGTGTGDIKDNLLIKYEQAGMQGAFDKKLNVHNQYLQVFATLGLIGFIVFIASIIIPLKIALNQRNVFFVAFIFIFSINLLFESMWEKQDGVIFYALFNALLFFHFQSPPSQKSSSR